jgi:hypothetical protein
MENADAEWKMQNAEYMKKNIIKKNIKNNAINEK